MEQKRELSLDEMGKASGGTGEAYGPETNPRREQPCIPVKDPEENEPIPPAPSPNMSPVYCNSCRRHLGYTAMPGTKGFWCDNCNIYSYGRTEWRTI